MNQCMGKLKKHHMCRHAHALPSRMHGTMACLERMPSHMRRRTRAAAGACWLGGYGELLEADDGSQLDAKGLWEARAWLLIDICSDTAMHAMFECVLLAWLGRQAPAGNLRHRRHSAPTQFVVSQHAERAPTCAYSLAWPAASAAARVRASADMRFTVAGCSPNCACQGRLITLREAGSLGSRLAGSLDNRTLCACAQQWHSCDDDMHGP